MLDRKKRRAGFSLLGNLLIAFGLATVVGVAALYGYNYYAAEQARADPLLQQLEATAQAEPTSSPVAPAAVATGENATARASATAIPAATPASAATPTPRTYAPAEAIRIPAIDVNARVAEVGVQNGEYVVPKFVVGHYVGTANPGEPGNGVYVGHVESLSSGNVFADLAKIKKGQEVLLYTGDGLWRYRVSEIAQVPYDDVAVMAPTADTRITLITCTGDWDVRLHQYTLRLIVIAQLEP